MSATTTLRSRKHMEALGFHVELVEHWIPRIMVRKDLFGFLDLLCIHKETGEVCGVQSTSASNVSSRIKKITHSDNLPIVRRAGWKILVHGWAKAKDGKWKVREEDIS